MDLQEYDSLHISTCSDPEALSTQCFCVFMESSLHRHELIKSVAIGDGTQAPGALPSPEVG